MKDLGNEEFFTHDKNENIVEDVQFSTQNKEINEVDGSDNKTDGANNLKEDNKFSKKESKEITSDKLIFQKDQELIIKLLKKYDFNSSNLNKLEDSFLKNDFKLLYEDDFIKLFFNFDCLFNKFLINLFEENPQINSDDTDEFLINYLNDYINSLFKKITMENQTKDPEKPLILLFIYQIIVFLKKSTKLIRISFLMFLLKRKYLFVTKLC